METSVNLDVSRFPSGPLPLGLSLYVERSPIEQTVYDELSRDGCLLRIKAPRRMGKSSLLKRITWQAQQYDYHIVSLDCQEANETLLENTEDFLQWFCRYITQSLQLDDTLETTWIPEMGSKVNCKNYLETRILSILQNPLLLTINELNRLFEFPTLARDFLPMLRFWHEQSKDNALWQKLRLVLVYSTDVYAPLQLKQSPLNVGTPVQLPSFTFEQIKMLAQLYGLSWSDNQQSDLQALHQMIDGHPYLASLAFYYVHRGEITLNTLLKTAPTSNGIYRSHLQEQLITLTADPALAETFRTVVESETGVELDAIAVGSRGITDIVPVVKTIATELKQMGALPFVVPAMGSHGGASADGQAAVFRHLGITEAAVGAPIRSTMEVFQIGEINLFGLSVPIYLDRYADNADHIVVVNRIKPHTDFSGAFGSGWRKMLSIGLGNHAGALFYHRVIASHGYANVLEPIAQKVLATGKILGGVGILENAYQQTTAIGVASSATLLATEVDLLGQAQAYLAKLPFDEVDLLIVDELGKDISGSGMEPTVHGRLHCLSEPAPTTPAIKRIFVRDLTPASEGNALGIGFADFTTRRLVDKIDFKKTYINCITGIDPEDGRIPITLETDQEAIDAALNTIGFIESNQAKIVWIKNTSLLDSMLVSAPYQSEIDAQEHLILDEILGELAFNQQGNLIETLSDCLVKS